MEEEGVILKQSIKNIKNYRRCGNSIDGIDLVITYKDGSTQRFHSYVYMFNETVKQIKNAIQ